MAIDEWEEENMTYLQYLYEKILEYPGCNVTYEKFVEFCYDQSSKI